VKNIDLIGNRTRDFPSCSDAQPTSLLRFLAFMNIHVDNRGVFEVICALEMLLFVIKFSVSRVRFQLTENVSKSHKLYTVHQFRIC
jgi:hypothetical protein